MNIEIITLYPELFDVFFKTGIAGRAVTKGIVSPLVTNLRDFALNKYGQVDDSPYGGEAGMILRPEPAGNAIDAAKSRGAEKVILLSAQGRPFTQEVAEEYADLDSSIVLFCSHFKGLDERICSTRFDDKISMGDFILTGGEIPAMMFSDAVVRLLPGVLGNENSAITDSFTDKFLDHPQYTRPAEWEGKKVPDVLISGHHLRIEEWKLEQSIKTTLEKRPDLLENVNLSKNENKILEKIKRSKDE